MIAHITRHAMPYMGAIVVAFAAALALSIKTVRAKSAHIETMEAVTDQLSEEVGQLRRAAAEARTVAAAEFAACVAQRDRCAAERLDRAQARAIARAVGAQGLVEALGPPLLDPAPSATVEPPTPVGGILDDMRRTLTGGAL